jgi:hypothetical protein
VHDFHELGDDLIECNSPLLNLLLPLLILQHFLKHLIDLRVLRHLIMKVGTPVKEVGDCNRMLSRDVLGVIAHALIYLGRFHSDEGPSCCQAFKEGVPKHRYLKVGIGDHCLNIVPHVGFDALALEFLNAVLQSREKEFLEELRNFKFLSTFIRR